MRSLFGSLVMLFLLLPLDPLGAQQSSTLPTTPMSLASAATSINQSIVPRARDVPTPSSLAVAVARELSLPPPPAPITLVLKADLKRQRLTVIEDGEVEHVWPISSGRAGYATETGTFRPKWASRMHYSKQYDLAPMPHAVFFNKGTAFHATQAVRYLGRPASHGCIRLSPRNARKLFRLVHRHGFYQTRVVVQGVHKSTTVARRNAAKSRRAERRRSRYGRSGYDGWPWFN
jgi:lipoprotein-anchoring transpeptidase ErfK/SrfK